MYSAPTSCSWFNMLTTFSGGQVGHRPTLKVKLLPVLCTSKATVASTAEQHLRIDNIHRKGLLSIGSAGSPFPLYAANKTDTFSSPELQPNLPRTANSACIKSNLAASASFHTSVGVRRGLLPVHLDRLCQIGLECLWHGKWTLRDIGRRLRPAFRESGEHAGSYSLPIYAFACRPRVRRTCANSLAVIVSAACHNCRSAFWYSSS
jgi:hypothetical protein